MADQAVVGPLSHLALVPKPNGAIRGRCYARAEAPVAAFPVGNGLVDHGLTIRVDTCISKRAIRDPCEVNAVVTGSAAESGQMPADV